MSVSYEGKRTFGFTDQWTWTLMHLYCEMHLKALNYEGTIVDTVQHAQILPVKAILRISLTNLISPTWGNQFLNFIISSLRQSILGATFHAPVSGTSLVIFSIESTILGIWTFLRKTYNHSGFLKYETHPDKALLCVCV